MVQVTVTGLDDDFVDGVQSFDISMCTLRTNLLDTVYDGIDVGIIHAANYDGQSDCFRQNKTSNDSTDSVHSNMPFSSNT